MYQRLAPYASNDWLIAQLAVADAGELLGYSHGKETIPLKSGSTSPFPRERHVVILFN
jgi:hypothetical protein